MSRIGMLLSKGKVIGNDVHIYIYVTITHKYVQKKSFVV